MDERILVAYATKHGGTKGIAEKVAAVLQQAGLQVDVLPADRVGDLSAYRAIVLGSAVYAGQWRNEAVSFLEENESSLAERPVWIFSSGPLGEGDPVQLLNGWRIPEAQQAIADRIKPRDLAVFHGALDMDKLGLGEKMIVKAMNAPLGDFRDWDAITSWAEAIVAELKI